LIDEEISNTIPEHEYRDYFAPDFLLHPEVVTRQENANSKQYLELIVKHTYDNLKMVQHSPSVQIQNVPDDALPTEEFNAIALDEVDPDVRQSQVELDRRVDAPNEFYQDDKDQDFDETK